MVEVTEDDREIAAELAHALGMTAEEFTSGACDVLVQILARHRQACVQLGLDMAATWLENEASQRLHSPDIEIGHTVSVLEDVAAAIRKLGGGDA